MRWCDEIVDTYRRAAPLLPELGPAGHDSFVSGHLGVAAVLESVFVRSAPSWAPYLATALPLNEHSL